MFLNLSLALGMVLLATLAGVQLSRCVKWQQSAVDAGLPWAVGFGLGPMITGVLTVLALGLVPGWPAWSHIAWVASGLVFLAVAGAKLSRNHWHVLRPRKHSHLGDLALTGVLLLWVLVLLGNAAWIPLVQNDPLEYATVGRILFETRDLGSYPALHPETSASGFFGPWTHPPLYVALVYLAQLIQSHADAPGLMRMVSPWFALAATLLVFAMGRMTTPAAGGLAAILFVSTPLFLRGAGGSSIDALPILGMSLVLATMSGLADRSWVRGVAIGTALGLALWTHSQTILFIPLTIAGLLVVHGYQGWRTWATETLVVVIVAVLIALWPYARNIELFGSPISDNPAVFALPELAWAQTQRIARGLDNAVAVLQYGVFKGWFAPAMFAWVFWWTLLGAILLLRDLGVETIRQRVRYGARSEQMAGSIAPWLCLWVFLMYLAGVIASVLLGIDLMIKNDRYLLVILPAVSIVAGYGLARIIGFLPGVDTGKAGIPSFSLRAIPTILVLGAIGLWYLRYEWAPQFKVLFDSARALPTSQLSLDTPPGPARRAAAVKLASSYQPALHAMSWLQRETPHDAIVLAMRPADLYYAGRTMMSFLDPRMIAFYRETDPVKAAGLLAALGIQYVYVVEYLNQPITRTTLMDILSRPDMASLQYTEHNVQIFKLHGPVKSFGRQVDYLIEYPTWSRIPVQLADAPFLNRPIGEQIRVSSHSVESHASAGALQIFHKAFGTMLAPGKELLFGKFDPQSATAVLPSTEYLIEAEFEGCGYMAIWKMEVGDKGPIRVNGNRSSVLADNPSCDGKTASIRRRFVTSDESRYLRLGLEHRGYSRVRLNKFTLSEIN